MSKTMQLKCKTTSGYKIVDFLKKKLYLFIQLYKTMNSIKYY